MKKALVGYTGFVGSNLYASGVFDAAYNTKNIKDAYGTKPDLLVYAGLRAEKYLANTLPQKDMELITEAEDNIRNINPKKLVLISTIDVFKIPRAVDENSLIETDGLHPYGYNRYVLECWVREHYPDALIIRLPGLFGENIKKNFIYDFIYRIPFMLREEKMKELTACDSDLTNYYTLQKNGFYQINALSDRDKETLKEKFNEVGFSALNFTDSRNVYQFYPLTRLWSDIQVALKNQILLWHPATEPVSAGELYHYLTGEDFVNELKGPLIEYDYRTIHDTLFGGKNGYICSKEEILCAIKLFCNRLNRT